jgi:hypothetical protein
MKFTTDTDLQCKHCGFKKSKLDLYCFSQWDDARWSDMRELAPNQAIPAPIQFCPNCKHFYYIDAAAVFIDDVDGYNWIEPLSYEKILPSILDWLHFDWNPLIEFKQRLFLLWTFNDKFYRRPTEEQPSETDITVYRWNLLRLSQLSNNPMMIAEVFREASKFDWSLKVARKAEVEDDNKHIMEKIQSLAQNGDSKPFRIS